MLSDCSPLVREFALYAVAASTRRIYTSAANSYQQFCRAQLPVPWDPSAAALTSASVAEYAAHIGSEGRLNGNTLSTYLSGLSTWWQEESLSDARNPFESSALRRVFDGAIRRLDEHALQRRLAPSARLPPSALTPALLLQLEPALRSEASPRSIMLLAAAHTGVHTTLRPSELLGSKQYPERAPLAASIVFYSHPHSSGIASIASGAASRVPDRFSIDLGATKTDQAGRAAPKSCAVPAAVRALWEWSLLRYARAEPSPLLFALDGAPLLLKSLLSELMQLHELQGLGPVRFTGKSFRRGGNSEAAAAAMPVADLQSRGGWASAAMVSVYTTAEAAEQRRLALARLVPSKLS